MQQSNNSSISLLNRFGGIRIILLIIISIVIGWLLCWFLCFPDGDYTKHWNASKYKHYDCDNFFNTFKNEVSDNDGRFAGFKIQKSDLLTLIDSCSSTGDVYMAVVLDDEHNKILLAAGAPNNGTGTWNSQPGSAPNQLPNSNDASKDTIWYIRPDSPNSSSNIGYIIKKNNKLVTYDLTTQSEGNLFVNKILKTILPGREVTAGTVQGCPKNCPQVIATNLNPN